MKPTSSPAVIDPNFIAEIRRTLTQEVLHAAGFSRAGWGKDLLDILLWLPTQRLARKMAQFDLDVGNLGLATASRNLLNHFVDGVKVWGSEHVPLEGPVLLAGNHPGAYDSFAVASGISRVDLRAIASGVDFTRSLPATRQHLIYVTPIAGERMVALRQGLRHLKQGGLLLIFPTGLVDPDPALWPERALRSLQDWSESVEIFLQCAPETRLVVAITSHVLEEACARHPLTRLVRQDWQRRRLAEYIQVIGQLFSGRKLGLAPRVSFAPALTAAELNKPNLRAGILANASQALKKHIVLTAQ